MRIIMKRKMNKMLRPVFGAIAVGIFTLPIVGNAYHCTDLVPFPACGGDEDAEWVEHPDGYEVLCWWEIPTVHSFFCGGGFEEGDRGCGPVITEDVFCWATKFYLECVHLEGWTPAAEPQEREPTSMQYTDGEECIHLIASSGGDRPRISENLFLLAESSLRLGN